ncbi:class I mannose-6-phosphate isomerase [Sphingobacterium griseoflavum]|uniref:ROK family transcriptional regulator n=1 Tax=Sphingobacterium griseoflavum TaxID=1474952 RepID=A0ABQ3HU32_9SPHI|nr:class I mannose-6-phosphate isomerase [Sphingobacterium griseoflavum]GHE31642.1 hypothetical protein GCM10017764_13470 [Sphingobacterium griseoflavum]
MKSKTDRLSDEGASSWRKSGERLLPSDISQIVPAKNGYDIYPYHPMASGNIADIGQLADWIIDQGTVSIDGYVGVLWKQLAELLQREFDQRGVRVNWIPTSDFMKESAAIDALVSPFLGPADSVWGTKTSLMLTDFFDMPQRKLETTDGINVVLGIGAALVCTETPVVYVDIPKNEIQYRMRAGAIKNVGYVGEASAAAVYKRFYFVDWVVLNNHKEAILNRIQAVADGQQLDRLHWMFMADLKDALHHIAHSVFRVRPWFEAGAWGGHWMQNRFAGLNKEEVNYAWSFELIVPENGLVFENGGKLLEVAFDWLMLFEQEAILGKHAEIFKTEFPIRFDFLDTFEGGNLSIQCHPSLSYIRENFGEHITQDETYYILDSKADAKVYLGFQEDIDPSDFRQALERSQAVQQELNIEQYVQAMPAKKHDLFLIPNGTVHSAGVNNLVLEISATPYIFTFKMYDWVRLGLDGSPRPINIEHAFRNLNFDRKGKRVEEELIAKPYVLENGEDWSIMHLPTHADHFYDVHRLEFDNDMSVQTRNCCHVLMLVEGVCIVVETADGSEKVLHYAETFVIPAGAKSYRLRNMDNERAKVIKAFVKDDVTYLLQHEAKTKQSTPNGGKSGDFS